MTRWDRRIFLRAAVFALLVLGLGWLVTAVTDEGGVAWTERLGRTLPFAPACAGLGAWAALEPARARGEALALEALGWSEARVAAAAALGGALVALSGAGLLGASTLDVSGFFPRAARASAWLWRGGAFVEPLQGLRVGLDGVPSLLPRVAGPAATPGVPAHGRLAASAALALAGVAWPCLVALALLGSRRVRAGDAGAAAAAGVSWAWALGAPCAAGAVSVVLFQAAAAGRTPAWMAVLPAVALLAYALRRYRSRS